MTSRIALDWDPSGLTCILTTKTVFCKRLRSQLSKPNTCIEINEENIDGHVSMFSHESEREKEIT